MDHFHAIPLREAMLVVIRPPHDAAVDLHGDAGADHPEVVQELADRDPVRKLALLTVEPDPHLRLRRWG
jgi:hypothetical protein